MDAHTHAHRRATHAHTLCGHAPDNGHTKSDLAQTNGRTMARHSHARTPWARRVPARTHALQTRSPWLIANTLPLSHDVAARPADGSPASSSSSWRHGSLCCASGTSRRRLLQLPKPAAPCAAVPRLRATRHCASTAVAPSCHGLCAMTQVLRDRRCSTRYTPQPMPPCPPHSPCAPWTPPHATAAPRTLWL